MSGFVTLLGAGPGDPDLLTRRGLKRLAEADLVLYDALVCPELLDEAPRARKFFVGKRSKNHSVDQKTTETLMVRYAREGQRVVRLKCGDPYVFGRGGEEALILAREGIPFEVVPGVSSCIAAPQAAGIPVTHRGEASAFLCATGHDLDNFRSLMAGVRPGALTLVVLMGYRRRREIATSLIGLGWDEETPAALIAGATHSSQEVIRTDLVTLGTVNVEGEEAVTLVVGSVVAVGDLIAGREFHPATVAMGGR